MPALAPAPALSTPRLTASAVLSPTSLVASGVVFDSSRSQPTKAAAAPNDKVAIRDMFKMLVFMAVPFLPPEWRVLFWGIGSGGDSPQAGGETPNIRLPLFPFARGACSSRGIP